MHKHDIKKFMDLIKRYFAGTFPYEDTENCYYPEHAIISALSEFETKNYWCNCLTDGEHIHESGLLFYKDGTNKDEVV